MFCEAQKPQNSIYSIFFINKRKRHRSKFPRKKKEWEQQLKKIGHVLKKGCRCPPENQKKEEKKEVFKYLIYAKYNTFTVLPFLKNRKLKVEKWFLKISS